MVVLLEIPVGDGAVLLVEADREDIPGRVMVGSSQRGEAAVKAARPLWESLEQLEPMLRLVKERLIASMPERFSVEFGVKFGGEGGIVLTKGTAEVNLKVTMVWDRVAGGGVAPSSRYETAVVRLVVWAAGRPVIAGMGVLVGTRQVVTCAHVVNVLLGRDPREQARPDPSATVQVEFPLVAGVPIRTGRVQAWVPPPQRGEGDGDVAGLVLSEDAPTGATPARFTVEAGEPGETLRVFGYPQTPPRECGAWVDVDLRGDAGGQLIHVEGRSGQMIRAQPGYSGSPVWQAGTGGVVGLLHATPFADEPDQNAYLLPAGLVAEAWEAQFDYLLAAANPYRGLKPFTAEHAEVYFGRDGDIDLLTERVMTQPVVVVVGRSGAGKSSLVQAGLIPRLREGESWSVVLVRPGQDPWHRLAAGLLQAQRDTEPLVPVPESRDDIDREVERLRGEGLGPVARLLRSRDRPLLVVVDQFEELLTNGQPPDPQLLDLLLPPLDAVDNPARVVITLRADYLPALLALPGLGRRLDQRLYMLSPLAEAELRAAVERPAEARGVAFETGLVDQIICDTRGGSLPLLQFTLSRLWNTQRHRTLTLAGYRAIGGVSEALDRFAEHQVSKLPDDGVGVVDRALLHLVHTPAVDPGLTTRRRTYQSDLSAAEWKVVRHLADARLVIVDTDHDRGPHVELAHEALISSWQRLHRLIRDNADFRGWLAWVQQHAAENDPLPEARIAQAQLWLETRPDDIPDHVKAFVEGSESAAEARLRELSQARDRAEVAARRAEASRLAAEAELALRSRRVSTTVALALGCESVLTEPTPQGDFALRQVLRLHPRTRGRLDHEGPVWAVAFAADGTRVATASADGSARVFDAATGAELARLNHDDWVGAVDFAADGTRVATASADGSARVFDAVTGAELARLDHEGPVWAVAFAPDGTRVATGSGDGSARVFDAATGAELARLDHEGPVQAVAFATDGTRVVTASKECSARVFDAVTSAELARFDHDDWVGTVAFAPDGTRVATGSGDGSARVFDAATGAELARLDHEGPVWAVAFAADGTRVATASADRSARVFDATTSTGVARLDHEGPVWAVAFATDSTRVVTGSGDGSARVFDAATGAEVARFDHDGRVRAVAFATDGTRVATGSGDGSARVFDATTSAELARLDHAGPVWAVAFAADGTRVATASADGSARVFDAATGAEVARFDHDGRVRAVAFDPNGAQVATGSGDGSARVFDALTGAELARLDHDGPVQAVAFDPDGTRVATASGDGSARVFDALTGRAMARFDHDDWVGAVAFDPDGTRVATASADGSARLFEVEPTLLLRRALELMTRPLRPAELRRYSLPWNCGHIEQWLRGQAAAGDCDAAHDLVGVLLSRRIGDDVSEAETWCRWLADHGEEDMRAALGAIAVRRGQYDHAVELWREAATNGDTNAALKLAPVEAVDGHQQEALALLRGAVGAGLKEAAAYAMIIDGTAASTTIPSLETAANAGNTDALNFLGVAALIDGRTSAAMDYWSRSAELGDWSAPLLLTLVGKTKSK